MSEKSEHLSDTLKLVNEWLRFAETKNAAIFAANLALSTAFSKILFGSPVETISWIRLAAWGGLSCSILACISALASFVPRLIYTPTSPADSDTGAANNDNLLYFGHLKKYNAKTLIEAVTERVTPTTNQGCQIDNDYAEQIITNSRITDAKMRHFIFSAYCTFGVIVSLFLAYLASVLRS